MGLDLDSGITKDFNNVASCSLSCCSALNWCFPNCLENTRQAIALLAFTLVLGNSLRTLLFCVLKLRTGSHTSTM